MYTKELSINDHLAAEALLYTVCVISPDPEVRSQLDNLESSGLFAAVLLFEDEKPITLPEQDSILLLDLRHDPDAVIRQARELQLSRNKILPAIAIGPIVQEDLVRKNYFCPEIVTMPLDSGRLALLTELVFTRLSLALARHSAACDFTLIAGGMTEAVAVYRFDEELNDFIFEFVNDALTAIEKTTREALVGQSLKSSFPGVNDFGLLDVLQRVLSTGKPENHSVSYYSDNRIQGWRKNRIVRLTYNRVAAIYTDETANQLSDAELREAHEKLANAHHELLQTNLELSTANLELSRANVRLTESEAESKALLEMEQIIANSVYMLHLSENPDLAIDSMLETIGSHAGADHAGLFLLDRARGILRETHEWVAPGNNSLLSEMQNIPIDDYAFWGPILAAHKPIMVNSPDNLPQDALAEKDFMLRFGYVSLIALPIFHDGQLQGHIGLADRHTARTWDSKNANLLHILSSALSTLIGRIRERELLDTMFRTTSEALVFMNRDGDIVKCNPAAEKAFGFLEDPPYRFPGTWTFHDENGNQLEASSRPCHDAINNNRITRDKILDIGFGDSVKRCRFLVNAAPVRRPFDVEPELAYVSYHDISALHRTQTSLEDTRNRLAAVISASPLPIVMLDPELNVQLWNQAAETTFGYSAREVTGGPLPYRDHINWEEFTNSAQKLLQKGEQTVIESTRVRRDGTIMTMQIHSAPLQTAEGQITGIVSILMDITERARLKHALEESEQRYRNYFLHSPVGVFMADEEGRYTDVNPAACTITGFSRQELLGTCFFDLVPPATRDKAREMFAALHTNELYSSIVPFVRVDGETRFWRIDTFSISDNEHLGFITDLTDLYRHQQLLQQSLDEKETLLKEIHHRVKNNFQIITSLLSLQVRGIENETDRQLFLDIESRIRSMALVHEMLYRNSDLAHINFRDYINLLLPSVIATHTPDGVTITHTIKADQILLGIDQAVPGALYINEVITNCCKHAFTGVTNGEIRVSLQRIGINELRLEIRDNGQGFPDEGSRKISLGMELINGLAAQLGGRLVMFNDHGAVTQLDFNIPPG